jgi:glutamate/tyrosine decarboxylase-like PLP-dependent enzyme
MSDDRVQDSDEPRQSLDPAAEDMRRIGYECVDRIVEHWQTLPEQMVGRRGSRSEYDALIDEPLPELPVSLEDCLAYFFDRVVPGSTRVNHPRFHAHIPCPSSYAGALGGMLAAGTNLFSGSWLGGATICALELTVLRWLAQMLGYDAESSGILTSGGSMANLVGLATARARSGRDALDRGVIYVSREGHGSLNKAANILGFPPEAIREINVDHHFRMRPDELEAAIQTDRTRGRLPLVVAANAGTTNSGAIDPLPQLADLCAEHDIWFHIDAAYGGFAAITPQARHLFQGMTRADSLTLDPHKWLYCPMGIGCALVRDPALLKQAFSTQGSYLKDLPSNEVNFLDRGPELSRPARALAVWMVIRSVGRAALASQIGNDLRLARLAAELLRQDSRLEVLEPSLSVVVFRQRPQAGESESNRSQRDADLMESTLASGELMLSTTVLNGQSTLRLVVMNHRTTADDIRRSVAQIRKLIVDDATTSSTT